MTTSKIATEKLLLETSKKLNYALSKGKDKTAYALLQMKNTLRAELGQKPFTLPHLEARMNKK